VFAELKGCVAGKVAKSCAGNKIVEHVLVGRIRIGRTSFYMGDAWNQAQGLDREASVHKYILVSAVVTPASWSRAGSFQ
jgi:hypothetical protein